MTLLFRSAVLSAALSTAIFTAPRQTALDRYIAQPDSHYKYDLVSTIAGDGFTAYVLDMTSQSWRSATEVDRLSGSIGSPSSSLPL